MLLQVKDELLEYGIPKTLLRELKNIKHTLIISSSEIENVFEYPLSLLKDDSNAPIHFSLEKMQLQEFGKILLNDDFISSLIAQIKLLNNQLKLNDISELLAQVNDDELQHQNEMTNFEEFINNKLKLDNSSVITYNNNSASSFIRECNEISAKAFTLTSASSVESLYDRSEANNNIADLDELVKYINEETYIKKNKKSKTRKNKKNCSKNQVIEGIKETSMNQNINDKLGDLINEEMKNSNYIACNDVDEEDDCILTDKMVEEFKNELEALSLPGKEVQKVIPNLSEDFLKSLN